jgi:hypothetical protein
MNKLLETDVANDCDIVFIGPRHWRSRHGIVPIIKLACFELARTTNPSNPSPLFVQPQYPRNEALSMFNFYILVLMGTNNEM